MVIADIDIEEYKLQTVRTKYEHKVDIEGFNDIEKKRRYKEATKEVIVEQNVSPQEKWSIIVRKCKEIGKQTLGNKPRTVKFNDPELADLSQLQKKIRADISSVQNQEIRKEKIKKLRDVKSKIKRKLRQNEEDAIEKQLEKLEGTKNDSNRYYVLREM